MDYKMQGISEKSGNQHCGAKNFILTQVIGLHGIWVVDGAYHTSV
jgi:hypothetical protein